jgi:hypothetical protein
MIATQVDFREEFGPARSQGTRPTCIAFALGDSHAHVRGPFEELSTEHLYYHAVKRTPNGDPESGVCIAAITEALRVDGQCVEIGWPYLVQLPEDLKLWYPPASANPAFQRGSTFDQSSIDDVIKKVIGGAPTVLNMMLGERFFTPLRGVIEPGPGDADAGYHAVVAVGLGARTDGARFVLVRNSWGAVWGINGHAWVHESYLKTRLHSIISVDR